MARSQTSCSTAQGVGSSSLAQNEGCIRRIFLCGKARSEAVLPDLLDDHLLDAIDVVDLLTLQVAPQILQSGLALSLAMCWS